MKKSFALLLGLAAAHMGTAQDLEKAHKYAETITSDELYEHEAVLASDMLQGRATGEAGQYMAAGYIRGHFQSNGLQAPVNGSFFQRVNLDKISVESAQLSAQGKQWNNMEDILMVTAGSTDMNSEMDVVFAGKGSEQELKDMDLDGKAVLIYSETMRGWYNSREIIANKNAKAIFVVVGDSDEKYEEMTDPWKHYLDRPKMMLEGKGSNNKTAIFFVKPSVAETMLKTRYSKMMKAIEKSEDGKNNAYSRFKSREVTVNIEMNKQKVPSENVLGYVEGTDKKDEVIIVTAHYDHVGMKDGKIFNGADDDASGTSGVLEIAEAFAQAKAEGNGPRRSMLFMLVTAEELGLLGSQYYSENPIFPMENTVANLNIDMIGRVDEKHEGNPEYIYLIGSDKLSMDLHNLSEAVNDKTTNLELDYTYNDENDPNRYYYRSDHYNFAKHDVPVIFYFNGTHEDYHQHTDTIEKLNLPKMEKISRLVFYTAWELANRDDRIKLTQASTKQ